MPRYKQVWNEELGKSDFIEIGVDTRSDSSAAIHGPIEAFVSPVDGSIISDRKSLREHNKRNNVVNQSEFNPEFLAKRRKEREDLHQGIRKPEQIRRDKMEIYETITRLEREHNG